MIAGGVCRHPPRGFSVAEAEDSIRRTPHLECAGLLQVLALEEQFGSGELVDDARGQHGRAVNVRLDPLMRNQHVRDRGNVHHDGNSSRCGLDFGRRRATVVVLRRSNAGAEPDVEAEIRHHHLRGRDTR